MKIIVSVLNTLRIRQLKLLFECLGEHVLIGACFLEQVDEDDEAVVVDHAAQVLVEGVGCEVVVTLQRGVGLKALLLPEEGDAATNLGERIKLILIAQNLFCLHIISHITFII